MRQVCQVRYADLRQVRALFEGRLYDRPDKGVVTPERTKITFISQVSVRQGVVAHLGLTSGVI